MFNDKEIKKLCEALRDFKSNSYTIELDEAMKKKEKTSKNHGIKEEDYALHAFREVLSRFLIDIYDILDRATKDLQNDQDIERFWDSVRGHMEKTMKDWAKVSLEKCPSLKDSLPQILSDLSEFHERAVKFHKERQQFSLSLRKKMLKQEAKG